MIGEDIYVFPAGMKLSDNSKRVEAIRKRLLITEGYCPCVPNSIGKIEYYCPCEKARLDNICCCGLYEKE